MVENRPQDPVQLPERGESVFRKLPSDFSENAGQLFPFLSVPDRQFPLGKKPSQQVFLPPAQPDAAHAQGIAADTVVHPCPFLREIPADPGAHSPVMNAVPVKRIRKAGNGPPL